MIKSLQFHTKNGYTLNYDQLSEIWSLRNYPNKLIWNYKGDDIIIEDDGETFFFEIAKNKVVVLFESKWSKNHKHPMNLVVYNPDGTISDKIEAPKFKSKEMIEGVRGQATHDYLKDSILWTVPPHKKEIKNIWGKIKEIKIEQGFMDMLKKENEKIVITVSDSTYFEYQYLDIEKGEFRKEARYIGRY